ncbi:MAG: hypothetical protein P4N41_15730 [Negativicutes bacterium]|nr:hypothetical protein [Negativicutes bacterium]
MKKSSLLLVLFLFVAFSCSTALAFTNENYFWDQWREFDQRYHHEQRQEYREAYPGRTGFLYRDHKDYVWYDHQQFSRIKAYYSDDSRLQVFRVDARPYSAWMFLHVMDQYHGKYTYFARYTGSRDQAYFWIGKDTIIRVLLADRGRDLVTVWNRAEAEKYALESKYVTENAVAAYSSYYDEFPPEVAKAFLDDLHLHD